MSNLSQILEYNQVYVAEGRYEELKNVKYPEKKMTVLTCMDTRLLELLPQAMNLKNGDVNIIKNAGAVISQPFGGIMRSILVSIYGMNSEEVWVIAHHDCGMLHMDTDKVMEKMRGEEISQEIIDTLMHSGIKINKWLQGFDSVEESVINSVTVIRNHPLLPKRIPVHGLVIDPKTGKLDLVVDGYNFI